MIPLKNRILITLWILGNKDSFREVGDRFDITRSCAHRIFLNTCNLFYNVRAEYIKWPENYNDVVQEYSDLRRVTLPNVIGSIDVSEIPISKPLVDSISYYSRKQKYTIKVQAVCDANMLYTNVFVGKPGSCHDAAVWRVSGLYNNIRNEVVNIPEQYHIIGDKAYPLDVFLLTPYRDNGQLNEEQKRFNTCLSSMRIRIENAFAFTKCKFRRLKDLHMFKLIEMKYVIMTAFIIHNIIILNEIIDEEDPTDLDEDLAEENNENGAEHEIGVRNNHIAEAKRRRLTLNFL